MTEIPAKLVVIVGCAKSGTTALANHLGTRPDMVLGTEKEPAFFTDFAQRTWVGPGSQGIARTVLKTAHSYMTNFPELTAEQWAIDGSTDYIWCPESLDLLHDAAKRSEMKVICVVRDPLARAISEYNHTLRHNWETVSFTKSLELEQERMEAGWNPLFFHQRRSTIYADIARYRDAFQDDFMLVDYAELTEPDAMLARIADFIGVPHLHAEELEKANQSILPKNQLAARMIKSSKLKRAGRLMMPGTARKRLWKAMHTSSRNVVTTSEAEHRHYCDLMASEIDLCVADPMIPTQSWTKTLALR